MPLGVLKVDEYRLLNLDKVIEMNSFLGSFPPGHPREKESEDFFHLLTNHQENYGLTFGYREKGLVSSFQSPLFFPKVHHVL